MPACPRAYRERVVRTRPVLTRAFALVVVLISGACGGGRGELAEERLNDASAPVRQVTQDLRDYIPDRLESEHVPGLSITLIRQGEIVWEGAFGVTNTFTQNPVATDSVFEVKSIGKAITAYAALGLVESGQLQLDDPIEGYLDRPWLPRSDRGDRITLRQLLSHTSGLSSRLYPLDRGIGFEPGARFSYSNVGYQYVQAAIEDVSANPLDEVAGDTTFAPLAMTSSTFADRADVKSRLVFGHINYGALLAPLVALILLCFLFVAGLGSVALRLLRGRVMSTWRVLALYYGSAVVVAVPFLGWLNGGVNKWSFFLVLTTAALSLWLAVWFAGSLLLFRRLPAGWRSTRRQWGARAASALACITVFAALANAVSGPIPRGPSMTPGAAYSLKSTSGDLARFMIELSRPEHLRSDLAAQMVTPQVETSPSNSWGLGIAVYHAPGCDWLWHAGDDLDFHALMVMCPQTGDGVVVLTNGSNGQFVTRDIARRAMGVDVAWSR